MVKTVIPKDSNHHKGSRLVSLGLAAVVFTLIGILLAPQLPFLVASTDSVTEPEVSYAGVYPVVVRDGEYESPFVAVVENVQDAVVNISARSREQHLPWWYHGSNYSTSSGSGFFFREDGYILTNNHVVENAVQMTVRTASGYRYDATLVGQDPQTDLAVLKVEPEDDITVIPFGDSDDIKVGDWAIAIGNPFPQQGLDRTVTVGVISAVARSNLRFGGGEDPYYQSYIQTDASINPGNSGGPLLNLKGECVGVNAAISSPTGGSVGIGFAIPINLARAIVPDLIATGRATRGWLGIWYHEVTEREAKRQELESVRGITIDSVLMASPADEAGLREGDVIVGFRGQQIENSGQFSVLVSTARDGQAVPIEIVRGGKRLALETVIGDRDAGRRSQPARVSNPDDFAAQRWLGMELVNFTSDIARAMNIRRVDGVYIRRVQAGSVADNASISRGTIILSIDDVTVKSLEDVEQVVEALEPSTRRVPLIVLEPDGTMARKVIRP